MHVRAGFPDLAEIERRMIAGEAKRITKAMDETTDFLKGELRKQVIAAGMGSRMAKTWQGRTFPEGRNSLDPAAYVKSEAPLIIEAFSRAQIIAPLGGRKYLWLPTANCPRKKSGRKKGGTSIPMEPHEVLAHFNAKDFIILPGRNGSKYASLKVIGAKSSKGFRPATTRRKKQGRKPRLIPMFILVKSVRTIKLFDLKTPARDAQRFLKSRLES